MNYSKNIKDQTGQAKLFLIGAICFILIGVGIFFFIQTSYLKGDSADTKSGMAETTLDGIIEHMEVTSAIVGMCSRGLDQCIPSLVDNKDAVFIFWNEIGILGSFDEKKLFGVLSQSKLSPEERDQKLDKLSSQYKFLQSQINAKVKSLEQELGKNFKVKSDLEIENHVKEKLLGIYRGLAESDPANGYPEVYGE